jgi:hypothetical protein
MTAKMGRKGMHRLCRMLVDESSGGKKNTFETVQKLGKFHYYVS